MKKSSNGAFTLTELMIAASILLVAVLGLLSLYINCMYLNEANSNLVVAANDAQYVMEQIKKLAYSSIEVYTPPVFTNLQNETFSNPTVALISSGLKEVALNVSWTEGQRNKSFSLSTLIAQ